MEQEDSFVDCCWSLSGTGRFVCRLLLLLFAWDRKICLQTAVAALWVEQDDLFVDCCCCPLNGTGKFVCRLLLLLFGWNRKICLWAVVAAVWVEQEDFFVDCYCWARGKQVSFNFDRGCFRSEKEEFLRGCVNVWKEEKEAKCPPNKILNLKVRK